jgi:hypothetical protein
MIRDHRRRLLEYGAAVRLELEGNLQLLPLDDRDLLERAKPDGEGKIDPAKREAREDAQVKAALARGLCSFIILGGKHDVSTSVRRLGNGTTEYIRVTPLRYKDVTREE